MDFCTIMWLYIQFSFCFGIKDFYDKNFCDGKSTGLHADPEDCRAYYDCGKRKTWHRGPLTTGIMFNPSNKQFVHSWEMNCPVHKVVRELWTGVDGHTVPDLESDGRYACAPNNTKLIDTFCLYQPQSGDNYGQRLRSFFRAPETGNYTFQTSCDDSCQLWLSDSELIARKRLIIDQQRYVIRHQWSRQDQRSEKIYLKEANIYYMEILHKEYRLSGFVCVGVIYPTLGQERPLSSRHLVMQTTELKLVGCRGDGRSFESITCQSSACDNPVTKLKSFKKSMGGLIERLKSMPSDQSPSSLQQMTQVTEESAIIINDVFEDKENVEWQKLNNSLAMEIAKEAESFGRELAEKWINMSSIIGSSEANVVLQASVLTDDYMFIAREQNKNWEEIDDLLRIRFTGSTSRNKTKVFSIIYRRLHELLPLRPVLKENDGHVEIYELNSRIIGSLLTSTNQHQLQEIDVSVMLKHIKHNSNATLVPVCAWWDFTAGRENGSGLWSTKGCQLDEASSNETHSVCRCNHLTNFAVLMQVTSSTEMSKSHAVALEIITYMGCGLSLLGVILTVLIISCLSGLRSERNLIHLNLSLAIGIFQIIFLAGIEATSNKIACTLVAVLLHYFVLVSFAWMLVEGVYLYIMVITVFENSKELLRIYGACAYGLPGILVLIAASIAHKGYGTDSSCWLSVADGVIYAFVSPALTIIVVNCIILALVIKEIITIQTNGVSHSTKFVLVKSGVKSAIVLCPLLGVTWVFGILALDSKTIVFQYLFAIFNSLQGFFIFIFHCLLNSEIRKAIQRKKEIWTSRRSTLFPPSSTIASSEKKTTSTTAGGTTSALNVVSLSDDADVNDSQPIPTPVTKSNTHVHEQVHISPDDVKTSLPIKPSNGHRGSPAWLDKGTNSGSKRVGTKYPVKLPPVTSPRDKKRHKKGMTKKNLRQNSKSKVNVTMEPVQEHMADKNVDV